MTRRARVVRCARLSTPARVVQRIDARDAPAGATGHVAASDARVDAPMGNVDAPRWSVVLRRALYVVAGRVHGARCAEGATGLVQGRSARADWRLRNAPWLTPGLSAQGHDWLIG